MKYLQVAFGIFLLLPFFGCTHSNKENIVFKNSVIKLKDPETITNGYLKLISVDKPLSFLEDIEFVNDYILVISGNSLEMVKIIDPATGKIIKSFGRKGQGPDEFIGLWSIYKDPLQKNCFWLHDLTTTKLKKFCLDSILKGEHNPVEIVSNLNGFFHLTLLPDYSVAGVGYFSDSRIKIKKKNGKLIKLGCVPVISKKFKKQHSQGYDANIIFLPQNKTFILLTIWGGLIEKYELNKGLKKVFMLPDGFFPQYKIIQSESGNHWTFNENSRRGIIDAKYSKSKKRIFLLFSGKKVSLGKNKGNDRAKILYVFNPENNFLEKKIILTKGLEHFAIYEKPETFYIYGVAGDKLYKIEW